MQDNAIRKYFKPTLSTDDREILYSILREIDRLELPYTLYAGSLLGFYRFGNVLPWDDDIDILILEDLCMEDLREGLPGLALAQKNQQLIKVFPENAKHMPGRTWGRPFVDVLKSFQENGRVCHHSMWGGVDRFPKSVVYPLQRARFGPIEVSVVQDPEAMCVMKFGRETLHSARPPYWDHKLGKRTQFPQQRVPLNDIIRIHGYQMRKDHTL